MVVHLNILNKSYGSVLRVRVSDENGDSDEAEISLQELKDALNALPN